MTLGFAPFGVWPLAVVSLAALVVLVRGASGWRQAAGAALVWGMGHGITALYWLPWAFYKDSDGDLLFALGGGIPAILGLSFFNALAYVLAAVVAVLVTKDVRGRVGVFVAGLIVLEMVRAASVFGFPWLPVGAVWAMWPSMMQLASVGGVFLLSALVLVLAVLLSRLDKVRVAAAVLLALAVAGFGYARMEPVARGEVVRIVQPNVQSPHKWDANLRWYYLQQTLMVAFGDGRAPGLVILPETAVAFYLDMEDQVRMEVAGRLDDGAQMVTGTVRRVDARNTQTRFYNSMVVLGSDGTLLADHDKMLLVPFGEFIPWRGLLELLPLPGTLRTLSQSRIDYSAGQTDPLMATRAGNALGLICYEGIFPWHVAKFAARADYLVNATNDNWFTGTIALGQHATLERLRAVETGRPLLRAANTGISVVYDGYGREVARLPINRAAALDVRMPVPLPVTPFVRLTGWLANG